MFLRKDVVKICSNLTGEHPCRSAISIELQSNFIEITLRRRCSSVNLLHVFKIHFLKNTSGRLLLTCGRFNSSYYGETERHLKVRSVEYIRVSPFTFRKVKPSKESVIRHHFLICNNIPSFDEFINLTYEHHKYILGIKESLLIKRERHVLSRNISSAKLFLYDNDFERFHYTVILFYYVI